MNIQQTGGVQGPQPVQPNRPAAKAADASAATKVAKTDQAEISDQARFLAKLRQVPEVRAEKIEAARQAIADGVYDTDEILRAAVERLLDESF